METKGFACPPLKMLVGCLKLKVAPGWPGGAKVMEIPLGSVKVCRDTRDTIEDRGPIWGVLQEIRYLTIRFMSGALLFIETPLGWGMATHMVSEKCSGSAWLCREDNIASLVGSCINSACGSRSGSQLL